MAGGLRAQRFLMPKGDARGMKIISTGIALLATMLLAACGGGGSTTSTLPSRSPGVTVLSTAVIDGGPAFVNGAQHAVYTFDSDTTNHSNCTGQCAGVWPPLAPPSVTLAPPWAAFARSDGSQQLSDNGKPLYTFTGDTAPDVANGNGLNGFHLARPAAGSGNGVPPGNPGSNP
jgi:predicted lipoprotein with Yx(FWY)xxD motif